MSNRICEQEPSDEIVGPVNHHEVDSDSKITMTISKLSKWLNFDSYNPEETPIPLDSISEEVSFFQRKNNSHGMATIINLLESFNAEKFGEQISGAISSLIDQSDEDFQSVRKEFDQITQKLNQFLLEDQAEAAAPSTEGGESILPGEHIQDMDEYIRQLSSIRRCSKVYNLRFDIDSTNKICASRLFGSDDLSTTITDFQSSSMEFRDLIVLDKLLADRILLLGLGQSKILAIEVHVVDLSQNVFSVTKARKFGVMNLSPEFEYTQIFRSSGLQGIRLKKGKLEHLDIPLHRKTFSEDQSPLEIARITLGYKTTSNGVKFKIDNQEVRRCAILFRSMKPVACTNFKGFDHPEWGYVYQTEFVIFDEDFRKFVKFGYQARRSLKESADENKQYLYFFLHDYNKDLDLRKEFKGLCKKLLKQ